MDSTEKLKLLKTVKLLSSIPDDQLVKLGDFLAPEDFADGSTIFEEGSPGDSLYFISNGHVRIAKKLRTKEKTETRFKELAILGPGNCFGEMALIEKVSRSADAIASGDTVLLRLGRAELDEWLKSNPELAMGFFAQLVEMLSGRLRNSSNELTLLFDLSHLLLEAFASPKELLDKVMTRIMQYLVGDWSAGAYVYNEFNAEMDLIDVEGDYNDVKDSLTIDEKPKTSRWTDDATYQVIFPGKKRMMGYLVFHRKTPLDGEEQNEFTRTMTTTARLITSALENIAYRTEDVLRARLKKSASLGGGY
ncbi:cyclic nucleotide-binding domain-containing protein [Patescibacteria group bacterium]|nr:cyclic nucleotide-binding domain-containing protein [Patescibacteria group bacterium]